MNTNGFATLISTSEPLTARGSHAQLCCQDDNEELYPRSDGARDVFIKRTQAYVGRHGGTRYVYQLVAVVEPPTTDAVVHRIETP